MEHRTRKAVDGSTDRSERLSLLPPLPNLCLVAYGHPRSSHALHDPSDHSSRCIDPLNSPEQLLAQTQSHEQEAQQVLDLTKIHEREAAKLPRPD
jgi:hypothetical protein